LEDEVFDYIQKLCAMKFITFCANVVSGCSLSLNIVISSSFLSCGDITLLRGLLTIRLKKTVTILLLHQGQPADGLIKILVGKMALIQIVLH